MVTLANALLDMLTSQLTQISNLDEFAHLALPVQATDLVLRFLNEFTELFDIAPDKTRVSVVQYSDQIRPLKELSEFQCLPQYFHYLEPFSYLTGLTRTGAAIEHVATEAFSEQRGARPISDRVARVCIVITDGRSQVSSFSAICTPRAVFYDM
ncbi:unnamed protein product [Cylicostephanus goldi]|uniref:VWFA domain-containing protein n=1 Tax=Cylicostephanus goldi TaxID=71465 RepID=A0A3P7Q229_CYLGO|nr:unnamed protein product [Cylicostephanus goldi]